MRDSNNAASSASIAVLEEAEAGGGRNEGALDSGGGVGIRPLGVEEVQFPGQLAQGVEHTVAARVVQKAFPKLHQRENNCQRSEEAQDEETKKLTDHRNKLDNLKGLHYRAPSPRQRRRYRTLT